MSLLSWFYGGDELQKQGEELDRKLEESNAALYGPGGKYYNAGEWAVIQQNMDNSKVGNVSEQLNTAFDLGWEEGKGNITGAVKGTFDIAGGGLAAVLKGVPWYVWAGVLLFFFWPYIARRVLPA